MSRTPFFTKGPADDICYVNTRDLENQFAAAARNDCEALWELFEPFADAEFLIEVRKQFDARYWEMHLTVYLIKSGYDVECPKPGPDVGIIFNGRRIWFEATSPTQGHPDSPDRVPDFKFGVAQDVPEEKIILRYVNSITSKYTDQYLRWLENGIVSPQDAFVVALNPHKLQHDYADSLPPRILQAAFAVGSPYVVIDSRTHKQIKSGYQFRDHISKMSGTAVSTAVFLQEDYLGLSALLCSRIDVANQPKRMGADFQLVPNPNARVQLPQEFRTMGTYFRVERDGDGFTIRPEEVNSGK